MLQYLTSVVYETTVFGFCLLTQFVCSAWASLVATLLEQHQLAHMCPHAVAVSSFFGGACAPGAKDPDHTRGSGLVPARLCSVCTTHNSSGECYTSANKSLLGVSY